jgi:hypothetical protein
MGVAEYSRDQAAAERTRARAGVALSVALHVLATIALVGWLRYSGTVDIVAAGPGEGGEGGGGSIEVGVADPSAILGFAQPKPISLVGDRDSEINNAKLEPEKKLEAPDAELVLTPPDKQKPDPAATRVNRPIAKQEERVFTGKDQKGGSTSTPAEVGRSYGSPTPKVVGGVGLGSGGGLGVGTGLPGGSAYGRIIQNILSSNYNPPTQDSAPQQYVIITLRISRTGKILSLVNGRVAPSYFKQRSQLAQVNYAAERAILASNLPPFPAGFLPGVDEAVAEIWFRYPK